MFNKQRTQKLVLVGANCLFSVPKQGSSLPQHFGDDVLRHKLEQDEPTQLTVFVYHIIIDAHLISSFRLFVLCFTIVG